MNYRHAFHAGNFADVFKHSILVGLLQALRHKAAPFCYVDTHAGAGRYDLSGEAARKTGEALAGVARLDGLRSPPEPLRACIEIVRALNAGRPLAQACAYPGSPLIATTLMRPGDRAILCEVQHDEAERLRRLFAGDRRIGVHERDGYAALAALLPPKERRGLILIDPPFETQSGEFRAIEAALAQALARWSTGVYAIWYPIKRREQTRSFQRWFPTRRIPKVLVAELMIQPDDSPLRLNGCGMIVVGPPWKFDAVLRELLAVLHEALAPDARGGWRVDWLTGERILDPGARAQRVRPA